MKPSLEEQFSLTLVMAGIALLMVAPARAQFFNGFPFGLPATIECEQFDTAGQGNSYYVLTNANLGGKYRQDGVSIEWRLDKASIG